LHCVGVIAKLAEGYVAGVADVASEPVVGVVMIENPFGGMPATRRAIPR